MKEPRKPHRLSKTLLRTGKLTKKLRRDCEPDEQGGPDDLLFDVQGDPSPIGFDSHVWHIDSSKAPAAPSPGET